ncbi:hypothetical protein RI367_006286 [Sorochytrium milnesiophthora]
MGGNTSKYEAAPLVAPQKPHAAFAYSFCLPHPVSLIINQKISFSGGDFSVKDANGTLWFRSDGRSFGWSQKVTMFDAAGQPVLNIKRQIAFFQREYVIHAGGSSGAVIADVVAPPTMVGSSNSILVTLLDGRRVEFVMKGSAFGFEAYIFIGHPRNGGLQVAKVARAPGIFGTDSLSIVAAPNVDIALLVALAILFDEEMQKK